MSDERTGKPQNEDADQGAEGRDDEAGAEGKPEDELEDKRMSLLEHLQELRLRLRNAGLVFLAAMVVSFLLVQRFFQFLVEPVVAGIRQAGIEVPKFQATTPTEGFWVMMKLAVVGGLIAAAPFIFWELWKFVAPGLYKKEKKMALAVSASTGICFAGGAVFGYLVLAQPASYFLTKMLTSFGESASATFEVVPEYRIENVADFLMMTLAGCGIAFELPVVLVLLGGIGLISARGLWRFSKYALILSAVAGAVLTPSTDVFTQVLLAGPLYVLYNISIGLVWLIERARRKKIDALETADD